jgi:hypothetical protein
LEPIEFLEGSDGELTKIVFKKGAELRRAGLIFSTGCDQASDLSQRLGYERGKKGGVVIGPETEESSVSILREMFRATSSRGGGCRRRRQAAVAINKASLRRDGFCG